MISFIYYYTNSVHGKKYKHVFWAADEETAAISAVFLCSCRHREKSYKFGGNSRLIPFVSLIYYALVIAVAVTQSILTYNAHHLNVNTQRWQLCEVINSAVALSVTLNAVTVDQDGWESWR